MDERPRLRGVKQHTWLVAVLICSWIGGPAAVVVPCRGLLFTLAGSEGKCASPQDRPCHLLQGWWHRLCSKIKGLDCLSTAKYSTSAPTRAAEPRASMKAARIPGLDSGCQVRQGGAASARYTQVRQPSSNTTVGPRSIRSTVSTLTTS